MLKKEDVIQARAKRNQGTRTDIKQLVAECISPINSNEELAKLAGVSHDTVAKVKVIEIRPGSNRQYIQLSN